MNIFISLGTNLLDRIANLKLARKLITDYHFNILETSPIYESKAVDYLDQPDFLNQVLLLSDTLERNPFEVLDSLLKIELTMGRVRNISKGPRVIDIDILFLDNMKINSQKLHVPHPSVFDRSFIMTPLLDLPSGKELMRHYQISLEFDNSCWIFVEE